jgi:hypothetical protein
MLKLFLHFGVHCSYHLQGELGRECGPICRSFNGSKVGVWGVVPSNRKGPCVKRPVGGKMVKLEFIQFVFTFMGDFVGVFDHFLGFPNDAGIVSVDVFRTLCFIEFDSRFVLSGLFGCCVAVSLVRCF